MKNPKFKLPPVEEIIFLRFGTRTPSND